MAVTGTNSFSVTRNDIIKAALRVLIVTGAGVEPTPDDYTDCSEALNIMIKSWAKKSFPLWVYQSVVVPMVEGVTDYPLGPTAGYIYSVSSTGGTGYTAGTWTAVGGTTGTVASGTYTVSGGVPDVFTVLVNGDSYTTAPTSFTLSGAGSGAVITGVIVGLTMSRPLRVYDAFIRNSANFDTTLLVISQEEYNQLGNKFAEGVPNQIYYNNQIEDALLTVYNVPSDSTRNMYLTVQRMFYDMTTSTDTFDFPQEWYQALKWNLANELSEEYEVEENKIMRIQMRAEKYLNDCCDWSQEEAGVYFSIDPQGTMRKW